MIDHHHGIAIGDQVAHDAQKTINIGGVQANGGLVHYVQHAGGAVSYRARKLHALALSRGKRGARAIKR